MYTNSVAMKKLNNESDVYFMTDGDDNLLMKVMACLRGQTCPASARRKALKDDVSRNVVFPVTCDMWVTTMFDRLSKTMKGCHPVNSLV